MLLRTNNKFVVVSEPAILNMPRPMYHKTSGMGGNRKEMSDEIKLLKFAEQFRPLRINGREVLGSYCAYGGLFKPLRISPETGIRKMPESIQSNVDHKVPNGHGGEDDCWNYQLLSDYFNLSPMKGERKTLHVVAEAYRRGGTIGGRSFEPMWDLFMWNWKNYHSGDGRATDIELSSWWPWWAREQAAPYKPVLFGYDEQRREMICSPEESLKMEFGWLAYNVLLYIKYAPKKYGDEVRETYEREYLATPEEMIKFAR